MNEVIQHVCIIFIFTIPCNIGRPSSVPSTKAAQCKRHAISAGLYNEAETFSETNDIDVQSEMRHFVLHGLTSSSDDNSSSNSSSSSKMNTSIEDGDKDNATDSSSISSLINADNNISSGLKRFRPAEKEESCKRSCSISTRYNGKRVEDNYGYKRESRVIYDWDKDGSSISDTLRNGEKKVKVNNRRGRPGNSPGSKDLIDLSTEDSDSTNEENSDSEPTPTVRHTDTGILRTEISVP